MDNITDDVDRLLDLAEKTNRLWPRPIPVSERLPEGNTEVLVFDSNEDRWQNARLLAQRHWLSMDRMDVTGEPDDLLFVTHWLPLPPKPERDNACTHPVQMW